MLMNRRELLTLGAGIPLTVFNRIAALSRADRGRPILYFHVSAVDDVIGVLLSSEIRRHQTHIEHLRRKHSFFIKLRYGSTNKFKVPFALDILEYFRQNPDLNFIARAQRYSFETNHGFRAKERANWVEVVGQQLGELIRAGIASRGPAEQSSANGFLDISSPGGKDRRKLATYTTSNMKRVLYQRPAIRLSFPPQILPPSVRNRPKSMKGGQRPAPDDLSELAAFLTGAAGSLALAPTHKFPRETNSAKTKVRAWVIKELFEGNITPQHLERNRKFKILVRGEG